MLTGVVEAGGHKWQVQEEKRQGPREQIFILKAVDASGSEMHIRPLPGSEATTIDEVQLLATDPLYRYFADGDDRRWEARMIVHTQPSGIEVQWVKFISQKEVYEGSYPFRNGLGARTDGELRELLNSARNFSEK